MKKRCRKKIYCEECPEWLFSCEGLKKDRNSDSLYHVKELAKKLVLLEHE